MIDRTKRPLRGLRLAWMTILLVVVAACGAAPQTTAQPTEQATSSPVPTAPATEDASPAYPAATAYPAPQGGAATAYPAPLGGSEQATTTPAPTGDNQGAAQPTPVPTGDNQSAAASLPAGFDPGPIPPERAARALADLLQRSGAEPAAVTVSSAEAVEWRDGSLGCPQPGMMYPQVITPGFRLVLVANGQEYAYHGAENGELFYCEQPTR